MSEITRSWLIEETSSGSGVYKCTLTETTDGSVTRTIVVSGLKLTDTSLAKTYTEDEWENLYEFGLNFVLSESKVYVDKRVLGTEDVTITDTATTDKYTLALVSKTDDEDNGAVTKDYFGTGGVSQEYKWTYDGTFASYNLYTYNYYELTSDGKITYTEFSEATGVKVAALEGLGAFKSGGTAMTESGSYDSIDGVVVNKKSEEEYTVTLNQNVLGTTNIALTDVYGNVDKQNANYTYTLALNGATDNKVGYSDTNEWSFEDSDGEGAGESYTGTYKEKISEYWQINGNSVTHNAATSTDLLTLTGLKSTATDSNVTVGESSVILGDSAIGTYDILLATAAGGAAYANYNLAFENNNHNPEEQTAGFSFAANGSAIYQKETTAGFSVVGKSATYSDVSYYQYFKLEGLSSTANLNGNVEVATTKDANNKYVVTLKQGALSQGDVTLTDLNGGSSVSDDYNYKLALEGVSSVESLPSYWSASAVGGTSTTITYMYDTTQGWALDGDSKVAYTGASTGLSRAVITGLKAGLTAVSGSVEGVTVNGGVITLGLSALGQQGVQIKDDVEDGTDYSLSLAGDVYQAQSEGNYFRNDSASGGTSSTFTYRYDMTQGWAMSGTSVVYTERDDNKDHNNLFTITGLSDNVTSTKTAVGGVSQITSINGITINDKTIVLDDSVLKKDASIVVSLSSAAGYSFAAEQGFTGYSAVDTDLSEKGRNDGRHWVFEGGSTSTTAQFLYQSVEGFELAGNSITFKPLEKHEDFTITGLSLGTSSSAVNNGGISFTYGTSAITLSRSVLGTVDVSIVDAAGGASYVLALDDDATIGTVSEAKVVYDGGKAGIKYKLSDYYTLNGDSTTITYTELDTAAGIKVTIDGVKVANGKVYGTSMSGTTVILDEKAFNKKGISFIGAQVGRGNISNVFKFAFADGIAIDDSVHDYGTAGWSVAGTSATYQMNVLEGYTLNDSHSAVGYSGAVAGTAVFMSLSGINSGVDSSAIVFDANQKTVFVKNAAVGTSSIELTIKDTAGYSSLFTENSLAKYDFSTYQLDFYDGYETPTAGDSYFTTEVKDGYGIINYKQYTTAGFSFKDDAHRVATYSPEGTTSFFALSGVSTAIPTIGEETKTNTTMTGVTVQGNVITLDKTYLTRHDITLIDPDPNDGINYSLSLAADVKDSEKGEGYFTINGNSATYQFDVTEGWLVEGTSSIKYHEGSQSNPLFSLEGLSTGLLNASGISVNFSESKAIDGGGTSYYYTVTLDKSVLGSQSVVLKDLDNTDNTYYSLSLASNVEKPGNTDLTSNHWKVETTNGASFATATYQYYTKAGYSIVGDSAVYVKPEEGQKLITIEGLSANLTTEQFLSGISVADGADGYSLITLTRDVLNKTAVTLTDNDTTDNVKFKFELTSDETVGSVSNASFVVAGESLNIQGNRGDFYTVTNDGSGISYTGASSTFTLAQISGLNITDGSFAGVSLSGTTILLGKEALKSKTGVTLDNKYDVNSNAAYVLDFDPVADASDGNEDKNIRVYDAKVWTDVDTKKTAKYQQGVHIGFTLQDDQKSITYSDDTLPSIEYMTIKGLSNGALSSAITLEEIGGTSYVVLDDSAIGKESIYLTTNATYGASYANYALSFANFDNFKRLDTAPNYWTLNGNNVTYSKDKSAGFEPISGKSAIYSELTTEDFFTITGLSTTGGTSVGASVSDARYGDTSGKFTTLNNVTINDYVITVGQSALAGKNVSFSEGGAGYTFALDNNVAAPQSIDTSKAYGGMYWTAGTTSGAFVLSYDSTEGYELGSGSKTIDFHGVNTTSVATVTGLNGTLVLGTGDNAGKLGTSSGETFTPINMTITDATENDINKKIVLTADLLGTTDVSVMGGNYIFEVDGVSEPETTENNKYWVADTTTNKISYQYDTSEGFKLESASTVLKHYDLKHNNVLTIAGLYEGIAQAFGGNSVADISSISGVTFNDTNKVITLDSRALAGASVSFSEGGASYKFALEAFATNDDYYNKYKVGGTSYTMPDGDKYKVATQARDAYEVSSSANTSYATATIKAKQEAYYKLDANSTSISYVPESVGSAFATISGLSTTFENGDLSVALSTDENSGIIYLSENALGTRKITLSNVTDGVSYKLDIGDADTPGIETGSESWVITTSSTKASATYKADRSAGYVLATDGQSITYVGSASSTEIFKISGLSKGVTAENINNYITFGTGQPPTIILSKGALGTSDITISNNTLGYKFELEPNGKDFFTEKIYANVWNINGNTATYEMVALPYYEYDEDKNLVKYNAQEVLKTYATITGLLSTSDLMTDYFGNIGFDLNYTNYSEANNVFTFSGESAPEPGILGRANASDTSAYKEDYPVFDPAGYSAVAGGTIKVENTALSALGSTVKLSSTGDVYSFKLDDNLEPKTNGDAFWTKDGNTTAVYRIPTTEGYNLTDATTIKKAAASDETEFARITGLNSNITIESGVIGYLYENDTFQAGITFDENNDTFTINNDAMLGTDDKVKVTITSKTGKNYNLSLDTDVTTNEIAEPANKWVVTKGTDTATATFSGYKPAYYTLDNNEISYTAEAIDETPIVTLTGLNKNVVAENNEDYGEDGNLGIKGDDGNITTGVDIDTTTRIIKLSSNVLGAADVTATVTGAKSYTLVANESDDDLKTEAEDDYALNYSGTTATLTNRTSEYYEFNTSSTVKYHAPSDASTIATITGLKNGLTADGSNELKLNDSAGNAAVEIDTDNATITLKPEALNKKTVELDSSTYSLAVDGVTAPTNGLFWNIDSEGDVTLSNGRSEGYTLNGKKLEYNADEATSDTPFFKITGLKGVMLSSTASSGYVNGIEGITYDSSTNTVKISEAILKQSKGDIEISGDYKLEIDDADGVVGFEENDIEVNGKTKGTLSYKTTTSEGWILDDDTKNKITYTAEKTRETKLTGLAKNYELELSETANEIGYKVNDTFKPVIEITPRTVGNKGEITPGVLTLNYDNKVLTTSSVTFTSQDNDQTLALASTSDDDKKYFNPNPSEVWTKSGTNKLIYAKNIKKETYTLNKDASGNVTGITYNKSAADSSPIMTLEGITNTNLTIKDDGTIDGITVTTRNVKNADGTDKTDSSGNVVTEDAIILDKRVLNKDTFSNPKAKVTLKNSKTAKYVLDIDTTSENAVAQITDAGKVWSINKSAGTATYQRNDTEGYTLSGTTTITYTAPTAYKYFTLKGLDTSKLTANDERTDIAGILLGTPTTTNGKTSTTITFENNESGFLPTKDKAKITLTVDDKDKNNSYALAVSQRTTEDDEGLSTVPINSKWETTPVKKGTTVVSTTATYKAGTSSGYTADTKGTSVTYTAEKLGTTYATIKGLPANITIGEDDIEVDTDPTDSTGKRLIYTLPAKYFESSQPDKITLTKGTVDGKLAIESSMLAKTTPTWTTKAKSGVATYVNKYTTAGYVATADSKTLNWTETTATPTTLITVKGLDKDALTDTTVGTAITLDEERTVTIDSSVLGTGTISLTGKDKTDTATYTLKLSDKKLLEQKREENFWMYSGTTATYVYGRREYYAYDKNSNQTLKYTPPKVDNKNKLLTLSNVKAGSKVGDGAAIQFDDTAKTITIKNSALDKKTITLKGDTAADYTLKLATDTDIPTIAPVKGFTGNTYTSHYELGDASVTGAYDATTTAQTITYVTTSTKATKIFTLNNAKAYTADAITVSDSAKTISLGAGAFDASVNKNITLKDDSKAGYKIIHSDDDAISNAKPTLSGDVGDASVTSTQYATVFEKNGTGTLNGSITSAGFYFTDSNTVTRKGTGKYTATIKGLTKHTTNTALTNTKLNTSTNAINVAASDIDSVGRVSVDGGGVVGFGFANDFSGTASNKAVSITGGSGSDTITAEGDYVSLDSGAGNDHLKATGSNVTVIGGKGNDYITVSGGAEVNGGAGNDYIDFGSSHTDGNTFVYAKGDGNDVIANFTANDKVKVTTSGFTASVKADGNDAVITITNKSGKSEGTITLENAANKSFTVYGSTDDKTLCSYTAANNSFDEDNFGTPLNAIMNGNNLGQSGDLATDNNYTNLGTQPVVFSGNNNNQK